MGTTCQGPAYRSSFSSSFFFFFHLFHFWSVFFGRWGITVSVYGDGNYQLLYGQVALKAPIPIRLTGVKQRESYSQLGWVNTSVLYATCSFCARLRNSGRSIESSWSRFHTSHMPDYHHRGSMTASSFILAQTIENVETYRFSKKRRLTDAGRPASAGVGLDGTGTISITWPVPLNRI